MTGLRPYRLASDPASFVPDRILEVNDSSHSEVCIRAVVLTFDDSLHDRRSLLLSPTKTSITWMMALSLSCKQTRTCSTG